MLKKILNTVSDAFTSASFDINGEMTVEELQAMFNKKFNCSLRVYKGPKFASPELKISSIAKGKYDGVKFSVKGSDKVGFVEEQFKKHFGVTTQIANRANTALADNAKTLGEVARGE